MSVAEAVNVIEVVVQFSIVVAEEIFAAVGTEIFWVITLPVVTVQPLSGSVIVTVYIPAVLTFFVVPEPPPVHA